MHKTVFPLLLSLCFSYNSFSQSDFISKLDALVTSCETSLPNFISSNSKSDGFRVKLEELVEKMDEWLKAGSGLTFDDMTALRILRKKTKAMAEFTWLGQAERNCGWATTNILSRIQEVYPDISISQPSNLNGGCVTIYRVQLANYVFYVGTHRDNSHFKRVHYQVKFSELSSSEGYCGIQPNRLTKFCDNSSNLTNTSFSPIIVKCVD